MSLIGYETRIGDERFIDLTDAQAAETLTLALPVHAACRIEMDGDKLNVSGLSYDWFMKAIEGRRLEKLRYVLDTRKNVVLTSERVVLRRWLLARAGSAEVFTERLTFVPRRTTLPDRP